MRAIRRTTITLPTLAINGSGGKQANQHIESRKLDPAAKLTFPPYWNAPDIRGALYSMQGKTCAYCGCNLPRNDRGDVEHFRPKGNVDDDPLHGGYWWLAYAFNNYLLSCSKCNRVRKKDRFPLRGHANRVKYENRSRLSREARILIDPSIDAVESWLQVDWRDLLCPIRAHPQLTGAFRIQVDVWLDFFRINQDPELVKERISIRDKVISAIADNRMNDASTLAIRYQPHSLVAKQILADRAPSFIPTYEDETRWLLDDIIRTLDITLTLIRNDADEILEREANELLWSLAMLWRDPPTGAATDIENSLRLQGVLDIVRVFYDKLPRD